MQTASILPNLFRSEYSKLIAVLCKTFGLSNIQLAEDIVSDTFLLAAETWSKKGVPDNQVAWLYKVAQNRMRDYLRREKIRVEKIEPNVKKQLSTSEQFDLDLSAENISDSQLRMLFAVCHPAINESAQLVLALRVLCGFTIEEIASALRSNKATINKRLFRAKKSLREQSIVLQFPEKEALLVRLDTVLVSLYLLFSEGYYSESNAFILRKELCLEAMRLTLLLLDTPLTNLPKVNALLALMCFHASRFEARSKKDGGATLYEEQDRKLWDRDLIQKGEEYLTLSSTGEEISKYHLEAAIAYWHTQEEGLEKWENILQLYNYLLQLSYSPIAALNRTYALAKVKGETVALEEALKLKLTEHHLYHVLLAELYMDINTQKVAHHLKCALDLSKSEAEQKFLRHKLDHL